MSKESIDELKVVISQSIKEAVNGKIDKLTIDLNKGIEELHNRLDEQDQKIAPAIETIQTFQTGRKFVLWALPFFAFFGALVAWLE